MRAIEVNPPQRRRKAPSRLRPGRQRAESGKPIPARSQAASAALLALVPRLAGATGGNWSSGRRGDGVKRPGFRSSTRGGVGRAIGGGCVGRRGRDGTTAIVGRTPPVSRFMVTTMVKPRTLIGGVKSNFHHPCFQFGGKPLLQTNGLLGLVSVFGRFLGCQILPDLTNFYQFRPKVCSEGPQTGVQTGVSGGRFI